MTGTELRKYARMLTSKQSEISELLRMRDAIRIEKSPDSVDETQAAGDRELAISNLNWEATLRRELKFALDRIEDGTYGYCVECEEEINPKRLAAVPWTALCIRCQEAADRHSHDDSRSFRPRDRFVPALEMA